MIDFEPAVDAAARARYFRARSSPDAGQGAFPPWEEVAERFRREVQDDVYAAGTAIEIATRQQIAADIAADLERARSVAFLAVDRSDHAYHRGYETGQERARLIALGELADEADPPPRGIVDLELPDGPATP